MRVFNDLSILKALEPSADNLWSPKWKELEDIRLKKQVESYWLSPIKTVLFLKYLYQINILFFIATIQAKAQSCELSDSSQK